MANYRPFKLAMTIAFLFFLCTIALFCKHLIYMGTTKRFNKSKKDYDSSPYALYGLLDSQTVSYQENGETKHISTDKIDPNGKISNKTKELQALVDEEFEIYITLLGKKVELEKKKDDKTLSSKEVCETLQELINLLPLYYLAEKNHAEHLNMLLTSLINDVKKKDNNEQSFAKNSSTTPESKLCQSELALYKKSTAVTHFTLSSLSSLMTSFFSNFFPLVTSMMHSKKEMNISSEKNKSCSIRTPLFFHSDPLYLEPMPIHTNEENDTSSNQFSMLDID